MSIAERIKYFRKIKALTQEELSKLAGLGHNAVNRIENEGAPIQAMTLKAISKALGVDPTELTTDREDYFFMKLDPLAYAPTRAHEDDAGFDLMSPKYDYIPAGGWANIDTGVHVNIPKGYAGLIVSKSGLNFKYGLVSDGLIDSGYTGSIRVKLYNLSKHSYEVRPGDKISQIVFIPIAQPVLIQTDKLDETDRGDNGFGSSGR